MQQIITAKLQLITTAAQFQALRTTSLSYRDALNVVSSYAFEHGKTSSNVALHRGMYAELRARYGLPSQLACSVERQVAATYKGLWTKLKKTDIRERTKRKKRRHKKNGRSYEQVSPKARKANRVYSAWSFAELHDLISYKAALCGGLAIKVDADYTSKACPVCGHTADENRPRKGLHFACQNPRCRYALHADLIGARNVTMRTLLVRHDRIRTGCLSLTPDTSDNEAKAARLCRCAELRWSPDASLRLLAGGH
jgi:hypothetical protein